MPPKQESKRRPRPGSSRRGGRVPSRVGRRSVRDVIRSQYGYPSPVQGTTGSPWRTTQKWAMAGQEDVEFVKMRYETTSAFTATGGAASYLQIKGNSIYRPYPGNTDSPAGYQRLYTQYQLAVTLGSRIEVRIWSDTGAGVQQPFRMAAVPCTPAAYTIYSAYANVASLRGVPHATEALFSPGATMPVLRSRGTNATILNGSPTETAIEAITGSSGFQAGTGADPTALWYHLVGLQAMAGTTTLNAQIQVMIEYDVMFYRPIGQAVQQLNRWGNEDTPDSKAILGRAPCAGVSISETKTAPMDGWEDLLEDERDLSAALEQLRLKKVQRQAGAGAGTLPGVQVKYQEHSTAAESKSSPAVKKPP